MSSVATSATLEVLDFPAVVHAIAGQAQTAMGHARLLELVPLTDVRVIERRQGEIAEFRRFAAKGGGLSLAAAGPLEVALRAVAVKGTVLDYDEMLIVYRTSQVNEHVRRRLQKLDGYPLLDEVAARLPDLASLVSQIDKVFDTEGQIKDSASPELAALRRKKRRLKTRVLETLEGMVKGDDLESVLRDRLVTQRGGRFVVPVRAGRKGALPGVVHDTSSSGQTVYVEPLASLDQQNELVEADHAERAEVRRLLADLTGHVRAAAGALAAAQRCIEELDTRQATASFADLTGAVRPQFSSGDYELVGARHPLMMGAVARLRDNPDDIDESMGEPVPLDFRLDASTRTVVITGPNTGGKTVVLKVMGLVCLLAQCGVPVPAAQATVPCCPRVHADIGDDQSIVANLSTFSAHLTRIKRFLDDSPPLSLVLLDELGTGTDPAEGAALGIAVLERLAALGVTTIASTHHDALKAFAHNADNVVNAAMEFNIETLQPTYRLRIGLPGRSNAFDIATRLGLNRDVVGRARALVGTDTAQLDSLIRSVEGEAEALASDREGVQQQQGRLEEVHGRYEALNQRLSSLRAEVEQEGRAAVQDALGAVRAAGEALLEELADELGEHRKSRGRQDRRAAWAAKVSAAEAGARADLDDSTRAAATAQAETVIAAQESPVADDPAAEMVTGEDPQAPLERGDAVLVMPLRLLGRVARDWRGDGEDNEHVEVDVHGKRLVVARRQVTRRNG